MTPRSPARQSRIERIATRRGCIGPYPCGVGAGANGSDLPCDCEAAARGFWRRYWRHLPVIRWWFMYAWPERCMSCERRWRDHRDECYFA